MPCRALQHSSPIPQLVEPQVCAHTPPQDRPRMLAPRDTETRRCRRSAASRLGEHLPRCKP
jgi:hypothetical protein